MNVSHEDAQNALDLVQETQKRLRRAISEGQLSSLLLLWGLIWIIGSIALHFLGGPRGGTVFAILDVIGFVATFLISRQAPHQKAIRGPQDQILFWHIWGLWIALILYGVAWLFLLKPITSLQLGVFLSTLAMFGYVVMGLWFASYFMVWLGLGVTVLTLFGYYLLPDYCYLWTAVTGGGTVCGTGLYIRKYWR
ncbi:hypothetical protein ACFL6U_24010 [Planctomycetota bacterium]